MIMAQLKVGVIGPAGFTGSYLCVELLNRGHHVIGFSRKPDSIGSHSRYTPRVLDINQASIEELAETFNGLDALVNAYGPHSAGHEALQYSQWSENHSQTSVIDTLSQCHSSKSLAR